MNGLENTLHLLKTNKMVSIGEFCSFTGCCARVITGYLTKLRKQGHMIKYSRMDELYFYGGQKCVY